jgi:hypothetical protein
MARSVACHDLGAVAGVFAVGGSSAPIRCPLAAGDPGEAGGAGAARVEAGYGVDDFLADQGAVEVVAVAADDPAVAVVRFRVVRLARAVMLDGAEGSLLQRRLVALDGYLELSRQSGL